MKSYWLFVMALGGIAACDRGGHPVGREAAVTDAPSAPGNAIGVPPADSDAIVTALGAWLHWDQRGAIPLDSVNICSPDYSIIAKALKAGFVITGMSMRGDTARVSVSYTEVAALNYDDRGPQPKTWAVKTMEPAHDTWNIVRTAPGIWRACGVSGEGDWITGIWGGLDIPWTPAGTTWAEVRAIADSIDAAGQNWLAVPPRQWLRAH